MNSEIISGIIEKLAFESIMAEPDDTDALQTIHNLFSDVKQWADQNSEAHLSSGMAQCILLSGLMIEGKADHPEKVLNILNKTISAIQHHARNQFSFSAADYPEDLFTFDTTNTGSIENSPSSSQIDKSPENSLDAPVTTQVQPKLFHPGNLPDYLGEEMFLEFLSAQGSAVDKMEALILQIETDQNSDSITELKRLVHTTKGEAGFLNLTEVEQVCHQVEDLLDHNTPGIYSDLLFKTIDWMRNTFNWYQGTGKQPATGTELFESVTHKTGQEESDSLKKNKTLSEPEPNEPEAIPTEATGSGKAGHSRLIKEAISVDAERLDKIIDMIGELVIAESMIMQSDDIKRIKSQELSRHLNQMNKITRSLQETGLSLRMLPIRGTFQKMARIARDTAKKANKKIQFQVAGEETELDKSIIDKLGDPLLHMIRNAIDHGIEKSEMERERNNKPATAVISVKAFHRGGNIHIEIQDDGVGLDKESILQKARETNLVEDGAQLTEKEIHHLIFEPGFSTAKSVTDLSGRGVGMNVVKSMVEEVNGQIDIRSTRNVGSVFTIKIPLTLAIIDGMIVRAGGEKYIIPTLSILTSDKADMARTTHIMKKEKVIRIQGELIPLCSLNNLFEKEKSDNEPEQLVVVVEENGKKAAILVDELLGKQQIVIKSLGESMQNIDSISGGAILADGRVGLIIDVAAITDHLHKSAHPRQDLPPADHITSAPNA